MPKEAIILVPGLWMTGLDMSLIRKRLARADYITRQFSYHSVRSTPIENAMDLHRFAQTVDYPIIHYVCHSLGGLIIRHLFNEYPDQQPGRVVAGRDVLENGVNEIEVEPEIGERARVAIQRLFDFTQGEKTALANDA